MAAFDDFQALVDHVKSKNCSTYRFDDYSTKTNDSEDGISLNHACSDEESTNDRSRRSLIAEKLIDLETKITPFEIVLSVKAELHKYKISMSDFASKVLGTASFLPDFPKQFSSFKIPLKPHNVKQRIV